MRHTKPRDAMIVSDVFLSLGDAAGSHKLPEYVTFLYRIILHMHAVPSFKHTQPGLGLGWAAAPRRKLKPRPRSQALDSTTKPQ